MTLDDLKKLEERARAGRQKPKRVAVMCGPTGRPPEPSIATERSAGQILQGAAYVKKLRELKESL